MNLKRSQEEYELLFSKKNEKGVFLSNTEIAKILGVSKASVGNARKKWTDKLSTNFDDYEVIDNPKSELKEITLSLDTFNKLIDRNMTSEFELNLSRNTFEEKYHNLGASLFNNFIEFSELNTKKLKNEIEDLNLDIQNLQKQIEKANPKRINSLTETLKQKYEELDNLKLTWTEEMIAHQDSIMKKIKPLLFQTKLDKLDKKV